MTGIRHHAVLVSGTILATNDFDRPYVREAHHWARSAFGLGRVTELHAGVGGLNGIESFVVMPSGSKEGWDEALEHAELIDHFIEWLEGLRYEDGSAPVQWLEVEYGDSDHGPEPKVGRWNEPRGEVVEGEAEEIP